MEAECSKSSPSPKRNHGTAIAFEGSAPSSSRSLPPSLVVSICTLT